MDLAVEGESHCQQPRSRLGKVPYLPRCACKIQDMLTRAEDLLTLSLASRMQVESTSPSRGFGEREAFDAGRERSLSRACRTMTLSLDAGIGRAEEEVSAINTQATSNNAAVAALAFLPRPQTCDNNKCFHKYTASSLAGLDP